MKKKAAANTFPEVRIRPLRNLIYICYVFTRNKHYIFYMHKACCFIKKLPLLLAGIFSVSVLQAQEMVVPLNENVILQQASQSHAGNNTRQRPAALSLPFFEDFTIDSPYPDPAKWADQSVWVNNNMAVSPMSRGVATFDALDFRGVPYDTVQPYNTIYADSLTSLPIDMSAHQPADSVYLSFFYQPQGHGFAPKPGDSLMLYLHQNNGVWQKVWSVEGRLLDSFRQVMIPITIPQCFYENFEFRFVNKATIGISNSQWNVDYIRLDANRNIHDTVLNDIAFTQQPTTLLNDFTQMPYRHFATDPAAFLKTELECTFKNNGDNLGLVDYGYIAKTLAGSILSSGTGNIGGIIEGGSVAPVFPMYNINSSAGQFTIEHTFYLTDIYPDAPLDNDTIRQRQVFGNAFAYDDGTAEKAYFLNLSQNAPGKIALEYAMYVPDTLRGVAIRFARQVPSGAWKDFSLAVYGDIAVNGGSDELIYQQDFNFPQYKDTVNQLAVYRFDQPVVLGEGPFYIGIILPAGGLSDSLMIALDMNRVGGTHRYFNVLNQWAPSVFSGALMVRPLVGAPLPVALDTVNTPVTDWNIYPNPAENALTVTISQAGNYHYSIADLTGKVIKEGSITGNSRTIRTGELPPGIYLIRLTDATGRSSARKFIKQ